LLRGERRPGPSKMVRAANRVEGSEDRPVAGEGGIGEVHTLRRLADPAGATGGDHLGPVDARLEVAHIDEADGHRRRHGDQPKMMTSRAMMARTIRRSPQVMASPDAMANRFMSELPPG